MCIGPSHLLFLLTSTSVRLSLRGKYLKEAKVKGNTSACPLSKLVVMHVPLSSFAHTLLLTSELSNEFSCQLMLVAIASRSPLVP